MIYGHIDLNIWYSTSRELYFARNERSLFDGPVTPVAHVSPYPAREDIPKSLASFMPLFLFFIFYSFANNRLSGDVCCTCPSLSDEELIPIDAILFPLLSCIIIVLRVINIYIYQFSYRPKTRGFLCLVASSILYLTIETFAHLYNINSFL